MSENDGNPTKEHWRIAKEFNRLLLSEHGDILRTNIMSYGSRYRQAVQTLKDNGTIKEEYFKDDSWIKTYKDNFWAPLIIESVDAGPPGIEGKCFFLASNLNAVVRSEDDRALENDMIKLMFNDLYTDIILLVDSEKWRETDDLKDYLKEVNDFYRISEAAEEDTFTDERIEQIDKKTGRIEKNVTALKNLVEAKNKDAPTMEMKTGKKAGRPKNPPTDNERKCLELYYTPPRKTQEQVAGIMKKYSPNETWSKGKVSRAISRVMGFLSEKTQDEITSWRKNISSKPYDSKFIDDKISKDLDQRYPINDDDPEIEEE
ncbi:hypothetical protein ACFL6F_01055 [Planctomycetota bacterium]